MTETLFVPQAFSLGPTLRAPFCRMPGIFEPLLLLSVLHTACGTEHLESGCFFLSAGLCIGNEAVVTRRQRVRWQSHNSYSYLSSATLWTQPVTRDCCRKPATTGFSRIRPQRSR